MSDKYYTIGNSPVREAAVLQAKHLLALPTGSWPETEQAETQLAALLPVHVPVPVALEFAARHVDRIHSSRMDWLRGLGQAYSMANVGKVYPALTDPVTARPRAK